jgi:hypothetical protein
MLHAPAVVLQGHMHGIEGNNGYDAGEPPGTMHGRQQQQQVSDVPAGGRSALRSFSTPDGSGGGVVQQRRRWRGAAAAAAGAGGEPEGSSGDKSSDEDAPNGSKHASADAATQRPTGSRADSAQGGAKQQLGAAAVAGQRAPGWSQQMAWQVRLQPQLIVLGAYPQPEVIARH